MKFIIIIILLNFVNCHSFLLKAPKNGAGGSIKVGNTCTSYKIKGAM